jgi:hypothetical protein
MGAKKRQDQTIDQDGRADASSEQDTAGHNTAVLQLGWDVVGERRRQAERAIRDTRPHVQSRRGILGRLRRRAP